MSPKELFDGENVKSAVIPGSVPLKTTGSDFEVLGVDHVDLTVTDTTKSLPFYEKILGRLGFRRLVHPHYHGFHNAHLIIGIKQADERGKTMAHNRFRPGLHHLALKAKERDDMERSNVVCHYQVTPMHDAVSYVSRPRGYVGTFPFVN